MPRVRGHFRLAHGTGSIPRSPRDLVRAMMAKWPGMVSAPRVNAMPGPSVLHKIRFLPVVGSGGCIPGFLSSSGAGHRPCASSAGAKIAGQKVAGGKNGDNAKGRSASRGAQRLLQDKRKRDGGQCLSVLCVLCVPRAPRHGPGRPWRSPAWSLRCPPAATRASKPSRDPLLVTWV